MFLLTIAIVVIQLAYKSEAKANYFPPAPTSFKQMHIDPVGPNKGFASYYSIGIGDQTAYYANGKSFILICNV